MDLWSSDDIDFSTTILRIKALSIKACHDNMSTVFENAEVMLDELMMGKSGFKRPGIRRGREHNNHCTTITYHHPGSRQGLMIRYVPVPDQIAPELRGTSVIAQIFREHTECLNIHGNTMTLSDGNSEVVIPLMTQSESPCKQFLNIYVLPQEDLRVYELIFNRMIHAMRNGFE